MTQSRTTYHQSVAEAAAKGLFASPKSLPSWLFYDETGDKLFQQIMRMPEYYPTRCEYDILKEYKDHLFNHFRGRQSHRFQLVELGAGDGIKTEVLLEHFIANDAGITYVPVDISSNALEKLTTRLTSRWPAMAIKAINESYDDALAGLRHIDEKKVILFMGANIGNFTTTEAAQFLKRLALPLSGEDMLLIGFDLKKDPRTIQEAYDDPRHLTASFNLNLLERLNRELGAQFDRNQFSHYPYYDPVSGTVKSFIISTKQQTVFLEALGKSVSFSAWEPVHTEVSQKYDLPMIEKLMAISGLHVIEMFFDADQYFCDVLVKSS